MALILKLPSRPRYQNRSLRVTSRTHENSVIGKIFSNIIFCDGIYWGHEFLSRLSPELQSHKSCRQSLDQTITFFTSILFIFHRNPKLKEEQCVHQIFLVNLFSLHNFLQRVLSKHSLRHQNARGYCLIYPSLFEFPV